MKVSFVFAVLAASASATLNEFDDCARGVQDVCGEGLACVDFSNSPSLTLCAKGTCVDATLPRVTDHAQQIITQTVAPSTTTITVTPTITFTATCSCVLSTTTVTTTISPTQTP